MNKLSYKGYIGSVEISEADNCLYGRVLQLPNGIEITYEGVTAEELRNDFIGAIDDYIAMCKENGIEPKRTYKGSFNVRVSSEVHAKLDEMAKINCETLNSYVSRKLKECVSL